MAAAKREQCIDIVYSRRRHRRRGEEVKMACTIKQAADIVLTAKNGEAGSGIVAGEKALNRVCRAAHALAGR